MPAGARPAAQTSAAVDRATPGTAARGVTRRPGRAWRHRLPRVAGAGVPGLIALLVNGYQLGSLSLWRDEAYSVEAARRPAAQILALVGHTDAVNAAYYLLLHPVIAAGGTAGATIRLPSVLAMAVTAAVTAVTGRRLAQLAALPAPTLTGTIAGLFFAAAPLVTRYAQEARSYAVVSMLAAVAGYLLLRALTDPRWRWWSGYALAAALAGLFNLFALLLLAAHGITVLIAWMRRRTPAPPGAPAITPRPWRWLAAAAAAAALLSPLLVLGYTQRQQISWLGRPGLQAAAGLAAGFAGSQLLILPVAVVALGGVVAGAAAGAGGPRVPLPPAALALPWLVLPPLILLGVSQVRPVYDGRYVVYCMPALALLCAAGLAWLTRLAARSPLGASPAAAWLPALAIGTGLAVLVIAPQERARMPSSRPDNMRAAATILAARERPGDGVLYLPANMRVMSLGYPAPYRKLRDVALATSPVAAANLDGTSIGPAALPARLAGVTRLWVVTGSADHRLPRGSAPLAKAELALLARWRLAGRWSAHMIGLRLYLRPRAAEPGPARRQPVIGARPWPGR